MCAPHMVAISPVRDRRRWERPAAQRRLRAGWGRPGGDPRSRWGRPEQRRRALRAVAAADTRRTAHITSYKRWEIISRLHAPCVSWHRSQSVPMRFITLLRGAECKKPRVQASSRSAAPFLKMGQPPRSCAARLRARPIFCVARLARAGHIAHTLSTAALLDKRGQSNGRRGRVVKVILEAGALSDALSSAGYSECIPVIVY